MGRTRTTSRKALQEKIRACAYAALSKKAERVVALDVRKVAGYADTFLVCSGTHPRQNQAIADAVVKALEDRGEKFVNMEGQVPGNWILIDTGDLVVHVFDEATRAYYNLENLWHDAPREEITDEPAVRTAAKAR